MAKMFPKIVKRAGTLNRHLRVHQNSFKKTFQEVSKSVNRMLTLLLQGVRTLKFMFQSPLTDRNMHVKSSLKVFLKS